MSSNDAPSPEERFYELLRKARAGSQEALGELFDDYRRYLTSVAREQLGRPCDGGDHASDVVQETMAHALRSFAQFHGHTEAALRAWLRRIVVNAAADCHRARERRHTELVDPTASSGPLMLSAFLGPSAAESALRNEEWEIIRAAIANLPENYQDVLRWHFRDRFSFGDIGAHLDISSDAARMLCVRAVSSLRDRLHEWGFW